MYIFCASGYITMHFVLQIMSKTNIQPLSPGLVSAAPLYIVWSMRSVGLPNVIWYCHGVSVWLEIHLAFSWRICPWPGIPSSLRQRVMLLRTISIHSLCNIQMYILCITKDMNWRIIYYLLLFLKKIWNTKKGHYDTKIHAAKLMPIQNNVSNQN